MISLGQARYEYIERPAMKSWIMPLRNGCPDCRPVWHHKTPGKAALTLPVPAFWIRIGRMVFAGKYFDRQCA
jgi:hypothetical protein